MTLSEGGGRGWTSVLLGKASRRRWPLCWAKTSHWVSERPWWPESAPEGPSSFETVKRGVWESPSKPFLAAQMVKSLPAVWKTQVRSLGPEAPLEKDRATHPSILAWESHARRSLAGYSPWGHKELDVTEQLHFHFHSRPKGPRPEISGAGLFPVWSQGLWEGKFQGILLCKEISCMKKNSPRVGNCEEFLVFLFAYFIDSFF